MRGFEEAGGGATLLLTLTWPDYLGMQMWLPYLLSPTTCRI